MLFMVCGPQVCPLVDTFVYCKLLKCPTFFKEPWSKAATSSASWTQKLSCTILCYHYNGIIRVTLLWPLPKFANCLRCLLQMADPTLSTSILFLCSRWVGSGFDEWAATNRTLSFNWPPKCRDSSNRDGSVAKKSQEDWSVARGQESEFKPVLILF